MAHIIKVAIVEDKKFIRESLQELIASTPGFLCTGAYESGEAAIAQINLQVPDVVLMDINLTGMNGVDTVSELKEAYPELLFIMCTEFNDDDKIFRSLEAGATGYILKNCSTKSIVSAIQEAYDGGAPMSSAIARRVIGSFQKFKQKHASPSHALLTPKEMEILEMLAKGLLLKEAAAKLDISSNTVRNHCANIYQKLHVNTRLEALNIVFGNKYKGGLQS